MKKLFFTITGCSFRYGLDFFKPGMSVTLIKEPDNRYDREAIRVELDGLGTVGYVANSPNTVRGTSMSAGRLYDKIPARIGASVQYVLSDSVIAWAESPDHSETEDVPAFTEYTADIDMYSNEDLTYLQPVEENDEAVSNEDFLIPDQPAVTEENGKEDAGTAEEQEITIAENTEALEEEDRLIAEEEAAVPADRDAEAVSFEEAEASAPQPEAPSLTDTVSAEDIASALKAALSGLTAGSADNSEEDPDADYIYGNKTGVTLSDSSPSEESAADTESPASSFGLTAADIAGILATGNFGNSSNLVGTETLTDESLTDSEPASETGTEEENAAPSVAYIDADGSSDTPGLNFNNARFPEEVEEDARSASVKSVVMNKETEADEDLPSPAGGDIVLPESEEELLLEDNTEENPEAETAEAMEAVSVEDTADPAAADEQTEAEAGELPGTGEGPVTEEAETKADAPSTDEEDYDFSQDRFQFDESELDDNLAQLHLEDIDATYLPENFLENLKKRLRESNH